jgi:cytochrome c-type biogenesis protein CcmH
MRLTATLLLALLVPFGAWASADDDPAVEALAKKLESELVAPCCWSQTVAQHHSPEAQQIKSELRARLKQGEDPATILQAYVAEHGTRILSKPPAEGFHRLLYGLPPAFLALTALALFAYGRVLARRRATRPETPTDEPAPLEPELRDRLDAELDLWD